MSLVFMIRNPPAFAISRLPDVENATARGTASMKVLLRRMIKSHLCSVVVRDVAAYVNFSLPVSEYFAASFRGKVVEHFTNGICDIFLSPDNHQNIGYRVQVRADNRIDGRNIADMITRDLISCKEFHCHGDYVENQCKDTRDTERDCQLTLTTFESGQICVTTL
ncbi:unnamed protein product [Toxocara canis]|uniref:ZP domain-containing protein n=1 Tax=Toxocara canis TaxID=6265 RepID=A0A183V389_TOXCA|nr:unnamed protein product [Toxocara canis]